MLPVLLPYDVDVFCLDFAGSGLSGGEYVSFGHHEEKDLSVAIRHLRKSGLASSIALWGRSMGAATAILRASKDRCLSACVLDSAFTDLRTVAADLASETLIPQFALNLGIDALRRDVESRAGFDLESVLPIRSAPKAKCPALFAVAFDDSFVRPHHTKALHDAWGGEPTLRSFAGGHNGERPQWFLLEAARFLKVQCEQQGSNRIELPLQGPSSCTDKQAHHCLLPRTSLQKVSHGKALAEKVSSGRLPPASPPPLMVAARQAGEKHWRQLEELPETPRPVKEHAHVPASGGRMEEPVAFDREPAVRGTQRLSELPPAASRRGRSLHRAASFLRSSVPCLMGGREHRDRGIASSPASSSRADKKGIRQV